MMCEYIGRLAWAREPSVLLSNRQKDSLWIVGCVLIGIYGAITYCWVQRMERTQLLWFCDVSLAILALGVLKRSSLVVSAQLTAICSYHVAWNIDFWFYLLTGRFVNGATDYMFLQKLTLTEKTLSCFLHTFVAPIGIYVVFLIGVSRSAWLFQTVQTGILFGLSAWLSSPAENVNWVFGFGQYRPTLAIYWSTMGIVLPLAIFWPTNLFLLWIERRNTAGRGLGSDVLPGVSQGMDCGRLRWMNGLKLLATLAATVFCSFAVSAIAHRRTSIHGSVTIRKGGVTFLELLGVGSTVLDRISFGDGAGVLLEDSLQMASSVLPRRGTDIDGRMRVHPKAILDRVDSSRLPSVPQEVTIEGSRSAPGSIVCAVVVSDAFYLQEDCDLSVHQNRYRVHVQIGGRGISEYVDSRTGTPFKASSSNELIGDGVGCVYVLAAVEVLRGEVVSRSPFCWVKRTGVFLPDDTWYVRDHGILRPLLEISGSPDKGQFAFQSRLGRRSGNAVYVADFLGYRRRQISVENEDSGFLLLDRRWCPQAGWAPSGVLRYCIARKGDLLRVSSATR